MNVQRLFVDDGSAIPVYAQLREQVLGALARGELRAGAQMPSVRDVAAVLGINPNTVNRAYAELEREGVLETRRGRGTFVRRRSGTPQAHEAGLASITERFVAHARSLGYGEIEIVRAVREHVERSHGRRKT